MDFRSPVVVVAPFIALFLACVGWLVLGGGARVLTPLDEAEARLAAAPPAPGRTRAGVGPLVGASTPLFGAATNASLRLEGVARTPRRTAALLAAGAAPAQWVSVGTTVGGFTLVGVTATGAVVESVEGRRTVALGETVGGNAAATPTPSMNDGPPPGAPRGLEPASAPAMR